MNIISSSAKVPSCLAALRTEGTIIWPTTCGIPAQGMPKLVHKLELPRCLASHENLRDDRLHMALNADCGRKASLDCRSVIIHTHLWCGFYVACQRLHVHANPLLCHNQIIISLISICSMTVVNKCSHLQMWWTFLTLYLRARLPIYVCVCVLYSMQVSTNNLFILLFLTTCPWESIYDHEHLL